MNLKGVFSHKSDHWATPSEIYDFFMKRGWSDPCPLHADFDAFSKEWHSPLFINPPYSDIVRFVDLALAASASVLLVPARTDTKWFARLWEAGSEFWFITGRLKFGGSKNCAPFPSMLVFCNPLTRWKKSFALLVPRDQLHQYLNAKDTIDFLDGLSG